MSGTSFDGVDAALVKTDGKEYIKKIYSSYVKYNSFEREIFHNSFLKNFNKITEIINKKHIAVIKDIFRNNSCNIDVIGLHGQTVKHNPQEKWTWQLINPLLILKKFNTNIISDFRINDVNNGGEGAPLVPIFHEKIILNKKFKLPSAILNIGGISNISILDQSKNLLGFDLAPGNGPLDLLINKRLNLNMDYMGRISNTGQINEKIKNKTISLFESKITSNSYDRSFVDNICLNYMESLNTNDALATLIDVITNIIIKKLKSYKIENLIVTGGGRKNNSIILSLKNKGNFNVLLAEDVNLDGDSFEAQAFAYLAIRSLKGMPYTFKHTTGVNKSCSGGVLYYANCY